MRCDHVVFGEWFEINGVFENDVPHLLDVLELCGREGDVIIVIVGEETELAHVRVQGIDVKSGKGKKKQNHQSK